MYFIRKNQPIRFFLRPMYSSNYVCTTVGHDKSSVASIVSYKLPSAIAGRPVGVNNMEILPIDRPKQSRVFSIPKLLT